MKKDSDALRKELEKEAPLLAGLQDKPGGFTVPEGYFLDLPENVMKRIAAGEAMPVRKVSRLWYRLAAAASVLLLAGIAFFLCRSDRQAVPTADEMQEYITSNIDDFELDLLIQFAGNNGGDAGWSDEAGTEDPEIEEYMDELLDEIDLETLEELL